MISAKLDWKGDTATAELRKAAWERVRRAVVFFWQTVQTSLNVSNPRPYKSPSQPGEPPRKRTGWLAGHVLYELDEKTLSGRVGLGKNALYGVYLEAGTRVMAARPWLIATLNKVKAQLEALLKG